jgi:hypothetical protein
VDRKKAKDFHDFIKDGCCKLGALKSARRGAWLFQMGLRLRSVGMRDISSPPALCPVCENLDFFLDMRFAGH